MDFFWSLFSSRPKYRFYARVDQIGICRAFKHCSKPPVGSNWVEVHEQNLSWLNQPLPVKARLARRAGQSAARHMRMA